MTTCCPICDLPQPPAVLQQYYGADLNKLDVVVAHRAIYGYNNGQHRGGMGPLRFITKPFCKHLKSMADYLNTT